MDIHLSALQTNHGRESNPGLEVERNERYLFSHSKGKLILLAPNIAPISVRVFTPQIAVLGFFVEIYSRSRKLISIGFFHG